MTRARKHGGAIAIGVSIDDCDRVIVRVSPYDHQHRSKDLVTVDQFVDFELTLEWQLQLDGNSGIKYLVREDRPNSWEKVLLEYYLNKLKDDPIPDHEARARVSKIKWNRSAIGFELQLNQQGV